MTVSVIVPMYNARAYVGAAIDSLLGQTRPVDEVIVVDDGSTDGSAAVVEEYRGHVNLLRQKNQGAATALNYGLRVARGDTIAFLDADDLWLPDKTAIEEERLREDPSLDGVFGHVVQFLSEDVPASAARYWVPEGPMPGVNRSALIVRRTAFQRFGLFDGSLTTADFVPWYAKATALGFRSVTLDAVVAKRRIHLSNTGVTRRHQQQQESLGGLREALSIRRAKNASR